MSKLLNQATASNVTGNRRPVVSFEEFLGSGTINAKASADPPERGIADPGTARLADPQKRAVPNWQSFLQDSSYGSRRSLRCTATPSAEPFCRSRKLDLRTPYGPITGFWALAGFRSLAADCGDERNDTGIQHSLQSRWDEKTARRKLALKRVRMSAIASRPAPGIHAATR
jgi:hypothetical protein